MICLSLAFSRFKLARDDTLAAQLCLELPTLLKEKPARRRSRLWELSCSQIIPFALILKFSAWALAAQLELPISGAAYMWPAGQKEQAVRAVLLANDPAARSLLLIFLVSTLFAQSKQTVKTVSFANDPTSHGTQVLLPLWSFKLSNSNIMYIMLFFISFRGAPNFAY